MVSVPAGRYVWNTDRQRSGKIYRQKTANSRFSYVPKEAGLLKTFPAGRREYFAEET
jgi:hypothetical protein